ncbi:MFS transporter [Deinococcus aluminii]|uniref:Enterobactin exporter EntS n=1 Tax=Deinococcus aluminii TaxID=1656885 RepID=A0ABP9XF53_9DEIO
MQAPPLMRNPSFLVYWLARASAALGDAMMFVALPYAVFAVSGKGNEQALATALLVGSLPRFLGLFVGSLIDRLPLRLPLLLGSVLRSLLFLGLAALLLWPPAHTPLVQLVYAAAFLNGLLAIFVSTAGGVLLPQLVTERDLPRANSLMQVAATGVPLVGYGVAGLLVASISVSWTVFLAALCFLVLPLCLSLVRLPMQRSSNRRPLWRDMLDGAALLLGQPALLLASVTAMLLNGLTMLLNVLIPGTMQVLGWGARGYGLFEALFSAGVLLGIISVSTLLGRLGLPERLMAALTCALTAFGLFAVSHSGPVFFAGALLFGMCGGMASVAVVTLFQLHTTLDNRGKVLGMFDSMSALGVTFATMLTGWLTTVMSQQAIFLLGTGIVVILWLAYLFQRRMNPPAAAQVAD